MNYSRTILFILYVSSTSAIAEVVFDGSLGSNNPGAILEGNIKISENEGEVRGLNLFHSFSEFNINQGERVHFSTEITDINNIFARITGANHSVIDGELISDASLWLMNPNGIIFNENARLDISGSFHATTADYLDFDNNQKFHAKLSENTNLSITEPSAFGFLDEAISGINIDNASLENNGNHTLSFVSGNINIDQSNLQVKGGDIHLVSTSSPGKVILDPSQSMNTTASTNNNITISNSNINVGGDYSGHLYIKGGELVIEKNSKILAKTQGSELKPENVGGIHMNADKVILKDQSEIDAEVNGQQVGSSIDITSSSVNIFEQSAIKANTYSSGNSGNININADLLQIGIYESITSSIIQNIAESGGDAGDISIITETVHLINGGKILASNGDIRIKTKEIKSEVTLPLNSWGDVTVISNLARNVKNAGDILIEADSMLFRGGGIYANVRGDKKGGTINLKIDQISMIGLEKHVSDLYQQRTSIEARPLNTSSADGGDINIESKNIILKNGAGISIGTYGSGQGGSMNIVTDQFLVSQGTLNAEVRNGSGGDVNISANKFSLLGASIFAHSFDQGKPGNANIDVNHLMLDSFDSKGAAITFATHNSKQGGNIKIKAEIIDILNNSKIGTSAVQGTGNAGSIELTTNKLKLDGYLSWITASTGTSGLGGDISIDAKETYILNGARISATAFEKSEDDAGSIKLSSKKLVIDKQDHKRDTGIFSEAHNLGSGGEINIIAEDIQVIGGGKISARTVDASSDGAVSEGVVLGGNAGNVNINTAQLLIDGISEISATTDTTRVGGDLTIDAKNIVIQNGAKVSVLSGINSGAAAGNIKINSNQLSIDGQGNEFDTGIFAGSNGGGNGGNINISSKYIQIVNQASISSEITDASDKFEPALINLTADDLLLDNNSIISTKALQSGSAGNINLNILDKIKLSGNSALTTESNLGGGGIVTLKSNEVLHLINSKITTNAADGMGNGGDIFIAPLFLILENSEVTANSNQGNGGDVSLTGKFLLKSPDSLIEASSTSGNNGDIEILSSEFDSTELVELSITLLDIANFIDRPCGLDKSEQNSFILNNRSSDFPTYGQYISRKIQPSTSTDLQGNEQLQLSDINYKNSRGSTGSNCLMSGALL